MVVVTKIQGLLSDDFRGKFGRPSGFGAYVCGDNRLGDYELRAGVYQLHRGLKKNVLSRHRDNFPTNPQTPAQQAWRLIFANGKQAWDLLDTESKQAYNERRYPHRMSGYNRFMSEYLKLNR